MRITIEDPKLLKKETFEGIIDSVYVVIEGEDEELLVGRVNPVNTARGTMPYYRNMLIYDRDNKKFRNEDVAITALRNFEKLPFYFLYDSASEDS